MPRTKRIPELHVSILNPTPDDVMVYYRGDRFEVVIAEMDKTITLTAGMSKHQMLEVMGVEIDKAWREGAAHALQLEGR